MSCGCCSILSKGAVQITTGWVRLKIQPQLLFYIIGSCYYQELTPLKVQQVRGISRMPPKLPELSLKVCREQCSALVLQPSVLATATLTSLLVWVLDLDEEWALSTDVERLLWTILFVFCRELKPVNEMSMNLLAALGSWWACVPQDAVYAFTHCSCSRSLPMPSCGCVMFLYQVKREMNLLMSGVVLTIYYSFFYK